MLIKGRDLTDRQRRDVLAAFGYRWTDENKRRVIDWMGRLGTPTIPTIPDTQWLAEHAFHFLKSGIRLMANRNHAEPVYMAD